MSTTGHAVASLLETRTTQFAEVGEAVERKLSAGKQAFDLTFSKQTQDLNQVISAAGSTVSNLLKSSTAELTELSNDTIRDLEANRQNFRSDLEGQAMEIKATIEASGESIKDALSIGTSDLNEQSESILKEFQQSYISLNAELNAKTADIASSANAAGKRITDTMSASASEFDKHAQHILGQVPGKRNSFEQ